MKDGTVGQFLEENIKPESDLSFVSAYFTIYSYDKFKEQLNCINQCGRISMGVLIKKDDVSF